MKVRFVTIRRLNNNVLIEDSGSAILIVTKLAGSELSYIDDFETLDVSNKIILVTEKKILDELEIDKITTPILIPANWNIESCNTCIKISEGDQWFVGNFVVEYVVEDQATLILVLYEPMRILIGVLDKIFLGRELALFFDVLITTVSYEELLKASVKQNFDARYVFSLVESKGKNYILLEENKYYKLTRHLTEVLLIEPKG